MLPLKMLTPKSPGNSSLFEYPSKIAKCTFFSSTHGIISGIDHLLGHKTNLNKFKNFEIISSIFSSYTRMWLGINYKKKTAKPKNT